jgi:hypothetical protein
MFLEINNIFEIFFTVPYAFPSINPFSVGNTENAPHPVRPSFQYPSNFFTQKK